MLNSTYQQAYEAAVQKYMQKTPKSKENFNRAKQVLAGGETRTVAYYHPYPLTIETANGSRLTDSDGNIYIDFLNNYTSMIHGHSHPTITKAIADVLEKGTCIPAILPEQVELAEILCQRLPSVDRIRFCNSGTEATMFAVRTARAFNGKDAIIKMEGGYHGTTDWAEYSMVNSDPVNRNPLKPIPESKGISHNAGKDLYIVPFNDLDAVEQTLAAHADEISAIIVEPVLGSLGIICPKPGYLQGLRILADKYDVLLIFDEVQTFRLSLGGAQELYGVTPDITAIAKIFGGGLPIGAFGGREDIMAVYDKTLAESISHTGTFNGNRPAMAGGIAAMKLLDQAAIDKLERLGSRLEMGLKKTIDDYQVPFSINRAGSLLQIHMVPKSPHNWLTVVAGFPLLPICVLLHLELLNRGVFIATRGTIALSTVMNEEDIDFAIQAFTESVASIAPLLNAK